MENNLDNFFKKKFDQREFEMDDAHWAQMEQMIEADEQGNHKGFLWKWLLGSLLLITVAGGLWWWGSSNVTESKNYAQTNTAIETLETENAIDKNKTEINNTITKNENVVSDIETNKKNSTTANKSSENVLEKSKNRQGLRKPSENNNNEIAETNNNVGVNKYAETTDRTIISTAPKTNIISPARSKSIIVEPNVTPTLQLPLNTQNTSSKKDDKATKVKSIKKKPIAESLLDIPSLDLLSFKLAEKETDRKSDLPDLDWLNLKKKNRWSFGMTTSLVSNPFDNNQSNSLLGGKFGLTTKYQLKGKLALNADLMYFYRGGDYEPIEVVSQDAYSFGRSVYRYELTPKNAHYLELPIYLTYPIGRHLFEGGISASYLLGVRGFTRVVPEEGPSSSVDEPHWISKNGFKEVVGNVMLGYRYQINSNLHFGVRATYSSGGYNDLASDNSISVNFGERLISQDIQPLHLNFKLTQYFGN